MSKPRKKRSTKTPGPVVARRPTAPATRQAMLTEVRELILTARQQVAQAVNARLTILHWQIGNRVHREILKEKRASYGAEIVSALSGELEAEFGRGFGRRNLFNMIRFAEVFPDLEIVQSLIAQLGWTHFLHIIRMKDWTDREGNRNMMRRCREVGICGPEFSVSDCFATVIGRNAEKVTGEGGLRPESRPESLEPSRLPKESMTQKDSGAIPPTQLVDRSYSTYTRTARSPFRNPTNAVGGSFISSLNGQ